MNKTMDMSQDTIDMLTGAAAEVARYKDQKAREKRRGAVVRAMLDGNRVQTVAALVGLSEATVRKYVRERYVSER